MENKQTHPQSQTYDDIIAKCDEYIRYRAEAQELLPLMKLYIEHIGDDDNGRLMEITEVMYDYLENNGENVKLAKNIILEALENDLEHHFDEVLYYHFKDNFTRKKRIEFMLYVISKALNHLQKRERREKRKLPSFLPYLINLLLKDLEDGVQFNSKEAEIYMEENSEQYDHFYDTLCYYVPAFVEGGDRLSDIGVGFLTYRDIQDIITPIDMIYLAVKL